MPPLAVIWDMDGTLVDTAELHFDAWVKLAAELGKPFSRADFAATFGRRNPEIIDYLFKNIHSAAEIADLGERKERYYRAEASKGIALLPGAERLLAAFADRGIAQAIGSSAPRANLEMILELTRSRRYFQSIVAMEDTQRGKPDPQVFLVAAAKLGADPARCVVFEDAVAGVQAAKAGGMKCVAVRFVGHHSEEALRNAGADLVVESYEAVPIESLLGLVR
jgi:beta-phosphoglucomutase family hydrolase